MIDYSDENQYPSDITAELSLIGHVLEKPDLMADLSFLTSKDFSSPVHSDIWQTFEKLYAAQLPITAVSVKERLEKEKNMELAGGTYAYLSGAKWQAYLYLQPVQTAKYLLKISQRRALIHACAVTAAEAARGAEEPEHYAAQLYAAVEKVTHKSVMNDFQDNYAVGESILQDLNDNRRPFTTGLQKLDIAMDGGLYPGKSYGFAARKKVGKTALAATISCHLNQIGCKHLFLACEMSAKEIHQRIIARMADVYPSTFRNDYGKSGRADVKLAAAVHDMPRNILYKTAPGLVFDDLRRFATIGVEKYKIQGFILDYWQLVGGKRKGQSTVEHLDEVAQWIADFSRKHGIWSVTMAQLNQDHNTRGGEGIRLAFDQVYELHRKDLSLGDASLEMIETRYTPWTDISGLSMNPKGPYFEQL